MVQFSSQCLLFWLSLSSSASRIKTLAQPLNPDQTNRLRTSKSHCNNRVLEYPKIIDMDEYAARDEVFDLDLDWMEIDPGFSDAHGYDAGHAEKALCETTAFMTRALGGSVPGPTLVVSPGTTMKIRFRNRLEYQPGAHSSREVFQDETDGTWKHTKEFDLTRLGKYNDPDSANVHWHGLHIAGTLPSDDTTLMVLPQEEFDYRIEIPEDHMPGLHWIHTHHRGSSALHLVGGAAMAIIVKDQPDKLPLPPEVEAAPERLLILQDWDFEEARLTARKANDVLLDQSFQKIRGGESIGQRFVTVNGKYQPIATIEAGKWERWRLLYAGWQDLPLEFGFSTGNPAGCEFYLLAKDGIYIQDYPRGPMLIEADGETPRLLPIPPGGRADFMVRCSNAGATTRFEALSRRNMFLVNVVEPTTTTTTTTTTIATTTTTSDAINTASNSNTNNSTAAAAQPKVTEEQDETSLTTTTITNTSRDNDTSGSMSASNALSGSELPSNIFSGAIDDDEIDDEIENYMDDDDHDHGKEGSLNIFNNTSPSSSTSLSSSSSNSTLFDLEKDDLHNSLIENRIPPDLTPWRISDLPGYLQSTESLSADDGCTCETKFDGKEDSSRVNEQLYRPGNRFMHTSYLGAVVERKLRGIEEHSYHQHVYPFQLVDFPNQSEEPSEFFKIGDWHDTILDKNQKGGFITVRYQPIDIPGKIIVHCHNTLHSDSGIIQKEYVMDVKDPTENPCQCDIFGPISGPGIIDIVDEEIIIGAWEPISGGSRQRGGYMVTAALLLAMTTLGSS